MVTRIVVTLEERKLTIQEDGADAVTYFPVNDSSYEALACDIGSAVTDYYYLYEYVDGVFRKLGRGKTPRELEEKFIIDDVMTNYSTANEIPPYSEVIDKCWDEIRSRQGTGFAGIPFKFPTLNEYVTIEKGELVVFAAEAKQGKSMLLLNCAVDLLKQDKSVLYLDSELSDMLFTKRILAHLSGVEYKRLEIGAYDDKEAARIEAAREWMKTRKFTHLYIPMFDLQSIYTAVKKVFHTQNGLDVLVVDYFKGKGEGDAFDSYQELGRFVDMNMFTLNPLNCWNTLRAA